SRDIGMLLMSISKSVCLIDHIVELFWKRHAHQSCRLQVDGHLQAFDRYGFQRQYLLPIENALGQEAGFAADFAVVDGYTEQSAETGKFRRKPYDGNLLGKSRFQNKADRFVSEHRGVGDKPKGIHAGEQRSQLLWHVLLRRNRKALELNVVGNGLSFSLS